jgi:putative transposase
MGYRLLGWEDRPMPWRTTNAMDARIGFIADIGRDEESMVGLCERYGISRQTGYRWLWRYRQDGAAGLMERSHAPLHHGLATPAALVTAIEGLRRERPSWGPRKIIAKLSMQEPSLQWPSPSTAGEILKRAGLVTGRRLHRRAPPRLGELTQPCHANHVWRVDHKGWVRLKDSTRVEPLTMTDGFSRYLLSLSSGSSTREAQAKPLFERAFGDYGLPEVIRSDNGPPFASAGQTGLTQLSVWWIKLGIRHERIDPGSPQQNGGHERFHRTLLEAMVPVSADLSEQERRFAAFRHDYNDERPHEALGQKVPASFYHASARTMPDRLPEPHYPAEWAVRKVRSNGEIRWRGNLIFLSTALIDEIVAVEETDQGDWMVRFFDSPLGCIDDKAQKLRRPLAPKLGSQRAKPAPDTQKV